MPSHCTCLKQKLMYKSCKKSLHRNELRATGKLLIVSMYVDRHRRRHHHHRKVKGELVGYGVCLLLNSARLMLLELLLRPNVRSLRHLLREKERASVVMWKPKDRLTARDVTNITVCVFKTVASSYLLHPHLHLLKTRRWFHSKNRGEQFLTVSSLRTYCSETHGICLSVLSWNVRCSALTLEIPLL